MRTGHGPNDHASRQSAGLDRRRFLRGVGACVALPLFESLLPARLLADGAAVGEKLAATATGAPLRSAFVFVPNGAIPSAWWPEGKGTDFKLSRTLQPLEKSRAFVQVLGGLNHKTAEPGPDGAGDHARGGGTFLTGVRLNKSATHVRAGVSIDQAIARQVGPLTRFSSLELTCEAEQRRTGACDSGYACAYQYNLSWSSPTTPMTPEGNPRLVFERLFGVGAPGERRANTQRRREEEKSVLDFVLEDARSMQKRLDAPDKRKLDQYLTGVREIETRIQKAERFGEKDPAVETPTGIPADYAEHVQLMYDLMLLAFQTDSTRVATFLIAHDGSNRSFDQIGISEGHHDLTHHMNRKEWIDKVADIDLWYVKQFAKFLERLEQTPDVDGKSLLHNSMIVYGSGNADANRHTHSNLPLLLAGGGGGTLRPGRYVQHESKPATNLFLAMGQRLGLKGLERFGDSTAPLADV
jgi:hypothetical protein